MTLQALHTNLLQTDVHDANIVDIGGTRRSGHDDVIKWKHFPRYLPFVRGIHRSPVNSPHTPETLWHSKTTSADMHGIVTIRGFDCWLWYACFIMMRTKMITVVITVMMTSSNGNILRVTGHLCGEFTGHRWIPRSKASDAELWYFLWSASE